MNSRSFHPVMTFITFMLTLFGLASGCISDPATDPANLNPIEQGDSGSSGQLTNVDSCSAQAITISGRTVTVDGTSLVGAWVAIGDNTVQEVVSETTSDQNGEFTFTLSSADGDYTLMASYEYNDTTLASWQSFSVYGQTEDLTFDLSLGEVPIIYETDDGAAVPPPYGSGCYQVYTSNYMCSWHVWYVATYWTGRWYCYALNGGINWVGVGSC